MKKGSLKDKNISFKNYKKKIDARLLLLSSIFTVSLALFVVFVWIASDIVLLSPPTQILLSWTDNSDDEDGFTVKAYLDSGLTQLVGSYNVAPNTVSNPVSYSIPLNALSSNTVYYFTVVAYNSGGQSPPSNTVSVLTPPPNECNVVGETRSCYTGPAGSSGVGICTSGTESCIDAGLNFVWNGVCAGQVLPSTEQCNAVGTGDFDCDGNSNCADSQCSTHSTCVTPSLTSYTIDGLPGSVVTSNQPHTLEIYGSNINSDAVLYVGGGAVPSNFYSVAPSGNSITFNVPAVPTFIDPSVGFYVGHTNNLPNPDTFSNTLTFAFENPSPTVNSIAPQQIVNPSGPTTVTVSGPGRFVATTDLLVTPPISSGFAPFYTSAFFGSPYVDADTLQVILSEGLPQGIYSFQATVPSAFGGELSSTPFSVDYINPSSCSFSTPILGCPQATSVSLDVNSDNEVHVQVSGISELANGLFTSDYILEIAGGLIVLPTTLLPGGTNLRGLLPSNLLYGVHSVNIRNSQNGLFSNSLTFNLIVQPPVISSIVPTNVYVNTPLSLTLGGTGFYSASNIELKDSLGNLIPLGVTGFVSSSELTYSLASGLTLPGTYTLTVINPSGDNSNSISFTVDSVCGDGLIQGSETCDQGSGNVVNGDGCSSTCVVEPGYSCTAPANDLSVCTLLCGNGVLDFGETCGEIIGGTPLPVCGTGLTCSSFSCTCQGSGSSGSNVAPSVGSGGGGGGVGGSSGGSNPPIFPSVPNSNLPTSNSNGGTTPPTSLGTSSTTSSSSSNDGFIDNLKALFAGEGELRLSYWIVIFILGSGIVVVTIFIVRTLRQRSRLVNLTKSNKTIDFKSTSPPSSYGGSGGYN